MNINVKEVPVEAYNSVGKLSDTMHRYDVLLKS
jgi:hypothetical protein